MRKKIGIMGGTFDPIHIGHLILGEKAYEQFELDQVWFMPAGRPPHKRNRNNSATDEQRVEMIQRAIANNDHFQLCLEDMSTDGYSYTYLLLSRLCKKYPEYDFSFIIGADSLFDFDGWKEPGKICQLAHILVAGRNESGENELNRQIMELTNRYHGKFSIIQNPNLHIASHVLREWVKCSQSIRYYVPDSVCDYIREQHIYQIR